MKIFGRASICFLLLTFAAWGQTQTFPALGSTNVFTGSNTFNGPIGGFGVITCGLVGDNVANDAPVMQSCVNANPGRRIRLPYTATASIIWTDEGGVKTFTSATWALNSVTVTGQVNGCQTIHAAASTAIQISVTGTFGTSAYAVEATAQQFQ